MQQIIDEIEKTKQGIADSKIPNTEGVIDKLSDLAAKVHGLAAKTETPASPEKGKEIEYLKAKVAELEEQLKTVIALNDSFFAALKPLGIEEINPSDPGAAFTKYIEDLRAKIPQGEGQP